MMFKKLSNIENAEMIKLSLIRGKLMELLAIELHNEDDAMEYFFTGLFSFIDVLLNRPMDQVLGELSLPDQVKAALLGEDNGPRRMLRCVIECEQAHWSEVQQQYPMNLIGVNKFMDLYLEAIKVAQDMNF